MRNGLTTTAALVLACLLFAPELIADDSLKSTIIRRSFQRGEWSIAETERFQVWTKSSLSEAAAIAQQCERLRSELPNRVAVLNEKGESPAWLAPCTVVVHPSQSDYIRHFPQESKAAVGCSTVTTDNGRVIFRRIDLRADASSWRENALPHELTHVLLADLFIEHPLPAWLNEGLAMLAEDDALRSRRHAVLLRALSDNQLPTLKTLLTLHPASRQVNSDVAYAASHSLVCYLADRHGTEKLVEFAEHLAARDCDQALRTVYGETDGIAGLEQAWRGQLQNQQFVTDTISNHDAFLASVRTSRLNRDLIKN
ncbi:peptidase MA family metallohydrolase [Planctomicrobium piriforme]|uniref:Peptidase MA superfamily protein n=1 Tax=Planctomicrobium piriforme TaxID=1576369 RepID=A0A1I3D1R9_9PLAN|nr:peptidase MA family metallohydrolase [Planctomicrobium piriforme]SFH80734.1 Peptidase MA superfamily protein [Planctomicrobium piriforme]